MHPPDAHVPAPPRRAPILTALLLPWLIPPVSFPGSFARGPLEQLVLGTTLAAALASEIMAWRCGGAQVTRTVPVIGDPSPARRAGPAATRR